MMMRSITNLWGNHLLPMWDTSYEHTAQRVSERYGLKLSRLQWNSWHTHIERNSDYALYITEYYNDCHLWRVKLQGVCVFVLVQHRVIRTAFPPNTTAWWFERAVSAAAKLGEEPFGAKIERPCASRWEMFRIGRLGHHAARNELFVQTVSAISDTEVVTGIWEQAKQCFPADLCWKTAEIDPQLTEARTKLLRQIQAPIARTVSVIAWRLL